jgi:hypothetical protein
VLDLVVGVAADGRPERLLLCLGAEPGQDVPYGEPADDVGVPLVGDALEVRGEPPPSSWPR